MYFLPKRLTFLSTTSQQPHDVRMRIQQFHNGQLWKQILTFPISRWFFESLDSNGACSLLAIYVQGLTPPHLAKTAFSQDSSDLQMMAGEFPSISSLQVANWNCSS